MDGGGLPEESRVKQVLKDEKDFLPGELGKSFIHSSVQFCFKFYLFVNYLPIEQKLPQGRIFIGLLL